MTMTTYAILVAGMQVAGIHGNRPEAEEALRQFHADFPGTAGHARLIPLQQPEQPAELAH
jgi:hypothetical protein